LILVLAIGAIVAVTGAINPKSKNVEEIEKAPKVEITKPVIQEIKPEPTPEPVKEPEPIPEPAKEPEPTPEPAKEPEPTPEPAKEPELTPEPEPKSVPEQEEPKEEINTETTQDQEAKPEEEEVKPIQEEVKDINKETGISMLNIILYILGVIAVIAAGIYFFMRREPEQSAADIARSQSQEPSPEPQEEQPAQEETYSEPEPETEQPVQEETQSETTDTAENSTSENTNDQSSNNDDENNNR
jgi:uncharacterized protein HemX